MTDPRPYWNDPETREIALDLIGHAGDAVNAMRAAGVDEAAVLDTLCGTLSYLIATTSPIDEDEKMIEQIAWALRGKLRDAREKLPGIQSLARATTARTN